MFDNIQTNKTLLQRMTELSKVALSAEEIRAQKVSFVLSSMPEESTFTRADVMKILDQREGRVA